MVWLVVTNSNDCRMYECQKNFHTIYLVKELTHPKSKLKNVDLVTDKPGHYKTNTTSRGTYQSHEEPKEIEIEVFARKIAHELNVQRKANPEKQFIIAALPHMNGLIYSFLEKHTKENVSHVISKNYNHLIETELLNNLKEDISAPV